MTAPDYTELRERDRKALNDHEQMADAQAQCVPCLLCGGKALIQDAGIGAGYYIACENSTSFKQWKGCLIDQRRVSGWAYNVMDWWNRLHSRPEASTAIAELQAQVEAMREALAPFAAMGRVMERRASITFGRHPKDSEIVCESSGEVGMGILTMGHFRDAAFLLPDAPGWGGQYRPIKARAALQPKDQSNG